MMIRPLNDQEAAAFAEDGIDPRTFYALEGDLMITGLGEGTYPPGSPGAGKRFLQMQLTIALPEEIYPLKISRLAVEPEAQLERIMAQMRAVPRVCMFLSRDRLPEGPKAGLAAIDEAQDAEAQGADAQGDQAQAGQAPANGVGRVILPSGPDTSDGEPS